MSATGALLTIVVAWIAIGVAASLWMGRRGHEPFGWAVLGAVLGPFVLIVATETRRQAAAAPRVVESATGEPGPGPVDVLVATDGSEGSRRAGEVVLGLLGPQVGRLTLATVVDLDRALPSTIEPDRRDAEALLTTASRALEAACGRRPETVMLAGKPVDALRAHALEQGYDLLVVGARGHGLSKTLMGSVASTIARGSPVPVLLVSEEAARPAPPA
jgi:nucleotide-binding universal stress UspA family protein